MFGSLWRSAAIFPSTLHPVRKRSLYCNCKEFYHPSGTFRLIQAKCMYLFQSHTHVHTLLFACFCIYLLSTAVSKVQLNCKHRSGNQQINDIGPRARWVPGRPPRRDLFKGCLSVRSLTEFSGPLSLTAGPNDEPDAHVIPGKGNVHLPEGQPESSPFLSRPRLPRKLLPLDSQWIGGLFSAHALTPRIILTSASRHVRKNNLDLWRLFRAFHKT